MSVPAKASRNGYQYRCKVSNDDGTTYSKAATLTVIVKPKITAQPTSTTAAAGGTADFAVTASGIGLSYQWQWRLGSSGSWDSVTASDISGMKTATLTVPVKGSRNGYEYRCKVSNSAGTTYSSAAMLTVSGAKPAITSQPADATAAAGSTAGFAVTAAGTELSYQWQYRENSDSTWKNITNTSYSGIKTAALTAPATISRDGYQYRCKVSNNGGTAYSKAATLTVE